MATEKEIRMIDIREPDVVMIDVERRPDGKIVLWVNVDQICRLRLQFPKELILTGYAKEFV